MHAACIGGNGLHQADYPGVGPADVNVPYPVERAVKRRAIGQLLVPLLSRFGGYLRVGGFGVLVFLRAEVDEGVGKSAEAAARKVDRGPARKEQRPFLVAGQEAPLTLYHRQSLDRSVGKAVGCRRGRGGRVKLRDGCGAGGQRRAKRQRAKHFLFHEFSSF